jgi:hypothetical protein
MNEYDEFLARGRRKLDRRLALAREAGRQAAACNGRLDCTAKHHLVICLSQKSRAG